MIVYSANTGNYDPPREDDILTFTEYEDTSPLAAARAYKCLPHLFLPSHDWSIWIDANVTINFPPEKLISLCKSDFGVFRHTHRSDPYTEAATCFTSKLITKRQYKCAIHYLKQHEAPNSLAMTMVVVRQNTPRVRKLNERWWASLAATSFRDQITLPTLLQPDDYFTEQVDFTAPNDFFTRKV